MHDHGDNADMTPRTRTVLGTAALVLVLAAPLGASLRHVDNVVGDQGAVIAADALSARR